MQKTCSLHAKANPLPFSKASANSRKGSCLRPKLVTSFCVLVALIFFLSHSVRTVARATSSENPGFDVIFIIDNSNSMNWEDPDRIAIAAVAQFVDLSFIVGVNARMGFTAFSDHRTNPRRGHHTFPLMEIATESDANHIISQAAGITRQGYTDVGWGFLAAGYLMAGGGAIDGFSPTPPTASASDLIAARNESGRQPIVILLTDGNFQLRPHLPEIGPYPAGMYPRSEDLSRQNVIDMMNIFQEVGIRVHTIYFDYYPTQADLPEDRALFEQVSDITGGLFRPIYEGPEEMLTAMEDIWAFELTGVAPCNCGGPDCGSATDGGFNPVNERPMDDPYSIYREFPFNIPSDSVFEAILTVRSNHSINMEQITLMSPSGLPVDITHPASNITFFRRGINNVLTMRRPEQRHIESGEWVLRIANALDADLNVRLLFYYDLTLRLGTVSRPLQQGEDTRITAYLANPRTGASYGQDLVLFGRAEMRLEITDPSGNVSTYPFATGVHDMSDLAPGAYILRVIMGAAGGVQTPEPVTLTVNPYPIVLHDASDITMRRFFYDGFLGMGRSRDFDYQHFVYSYFFGSEFDFTFSYPTLDEMIEITHEDGAITFTTVGETGSGYVNITVRNQWGATASVSVYVRVASWWSTFGIPFAILVAVLALAILWLILHLRKRIAANGPTLDKYPGNITINMPTIPARFGSAESDINAIKEFRLQLENIKALKGQRAVTLQRVLKNHGNDGIRYLNIFDRAKVSSFAQQMQIIAGGSAKNTNLSLFVPHSKQGVVLLGGSEIPQSGIRHRLPDDDECEVILQLEPDNNDEAFKLIFKTEGVSDYGWEDETT